MAIGMVKFFNAQGNGGFMAIANKANGFARKSNRNIDAAGFSMKKIFKRSRKLINFIFFDEL